MADGFRIVTFDAVGLGLESVVAEVTGAGGRASTSLKTCFGSRNLGSMCAGAR